MRINCIIPPISLDEGATPTEPVTLAEMKNFLIISSDETAFDTIITMLIKTARQQLETFLNISLIPKTITARFQNDAGYMELPFAAPTITINSAVDDDGNTINSDNYSLKGSAFCGYSKTPTPQNNFYSPCNLIVTVNYSVGYGTNGLPTDLKTLIMQQTSWLYEHRGDELINQLAPIVRISAVPYKRVV